MKVEIKRKDVFVIIAIYNGMKWLPRCLSSLKDLEVVVIDNNSNDKSLEYVKENFPEFTIFEQENNLGFGQANNIGLNYALQQGADYVFLLNQDAYIRRESIINLIRTHEVFPEFGILSPVHLNATEVELDPDFESFIEHQVRPLFLKENLEKEIFEVPFVNAAGWLISRKCLKLVGGFDPIFFHYGEDDNYCQRVRFHSLKVGVVSGVFMIHDKTNFKKAPVLRGSKEYFQKKERWLKVKFGNINSEQGDDLGRLIKYFSIRKLKAYFKLDINEISYTTSYLRMLKKVRSEVIISRSMNKMEGPNYLEKSQF